MIMDLSFYLSSDISVQVVIQVVLLLLLLLLLSFRFVHVFKNTHNGTDEHQNGLNPLNVCIVYCVYCILCCFVLCCDVFIVTWKKLRLSLSLLEWIDARALKSFPIYWTESFRFFTASTDTLALHSVFPSKKRTKCRMNFFFHFVRLISSRKKTSFGFWFSWKFYEISKPKTVLMLSNLN